MRRNISLLMLLLFFHQVAALNLWAQTVITARISDVSGSRIQINQGGDSGLKVGDKGVVYYMQTVGDRTVRVTVALARVASITSTTAVLQVADSTAEIMEGYLVDLSVVPLPLPKKGGSKWWVWLLVAAAGGGIAAAAGGGGGGDGNGGPIPPKNGTISIDLPAN
jgi:hypothetical protein